MYKLYSEHSATRKPAHEKKSEPRYTDFLRKTQQAALCQENDTIIATFHTIPATPGALLNSSESSDISMDIDISDIWHENCDI